MEIDYIKIGKKVYPYFVGYEWCEESMCVIRSVEIGFEEQFEYYKGVLYIR